MMMSVYDETYFRNKIIGKHEVRLRYLLTRKLYKTRAKLKNPIPKTILLTHRVERINRYVAVHRFEQYQKPHFFHRNH